jgi:pantoate--beta-alanine ligase
MKRIDSIEETTRFCRRARRRDQRIGFVPTMGALHEGHLSLVRASAADSDLTVVSIFVNPLQFGPDEDFESYPRDLDGDCARLEAAGAGLVFTTTPAEMYPDGFRTYVVQEELPDTLCGPFRPVHFRGVTTVVTKLLHIVRPHFAYFGQKDAQQCVLIERMVEDLNFDCEVRVGPTVREPDGLAMSSRNAYLSPEERRKALALHRSLEEARRLFHAGERRSAAIFEAMDRIFTGVPELHLEYRQIVDTRSLRDIDTIEDRALVAVAGRLGRTRLIDNTILDSARRSDR